GICYCHSRYFVELRRCHRFLLLVGARSAIIHVERDRSDGQTFPHLGTFFHSGHSPGKSAQDFTSHGSVGHRGRTRDEGQGNTRAFSMSMVAGTEAALSLRVLLAHSIDYAGLFPPTTLTLETALKNHATYLRSSDAWMLSTFVLPVGKFADAAWFISEFGQNRPLRISALGPKTTNAIDFFEELKMAIKGIREFSGEYENVALVNQLEMPLPPDVGMETLSKMRELLGEVRVRAFWEASGQNAERTISLLAEHNSHTNGQPFNFKLRTGGVTPDAFPSSMQIAKALVAGARQGVAMKFTAGLHHPIRMFRDEVNAKMHGFLNVLGAGVLAIEHVWDERQTSLMLEDENVDSFHFDETVFGWRDWKINADKIEKHRRLITSFGSCSFDEPRQDLRALKLL